MEKLSLEREEKIRKELDFESGNKITTQQLQIHIDWDCGCKITYDKLGSWYFPCNYHKLK